MQNELLAGVIDFKELNKQAFPTPTSLMRTEGLSLGKIISQLLPYLFAIAGLLLLLYLIWGGFSLMTSGGDPKHMDQAKGKITNAIIGFLLLFVSYWLVQILQVIFGLPKIF